MARSRRACPEPAEGTPAMLVGRCSSELSSHKLQAKSKKSQAPSEADLSRHAVEGSAVLLHHHPTFSFTPRFPLDFTLRVVTSWIDRKLYFVGLEAVKSEQHGLTTG